jgi:hypothetical protein
MNMEGNADGRTYSCQHGKNSTLYVFTVAARIRTATVSKRFGHT